MVMPRIARTMASSMRGRRVVSAIAIKSAK